MTLRFCLPLAGKTVAGREYTLFPSHAPWQLVAGGHAAPLDPFSKELLAHPRLFKALITAKVASQGLADLILGLRPTGVGVPEGPNQRSGLTQGSKGLLSFGLPVKTSGHIYGRNNLEPKGVFHG